MSRTTGTDPEASLGTGVSARKGARATATRMLVRDLDGVGALVGSVSGEAPPSLVLEDLTVLRLGGETARGYSGHGVFAQGPGSLTLHRADVRGTRRFGVMVADGMAAEVEDLDVADVRRPATPGRAACGVCAIDGGSLVLSRARVRGVDHTGVGVGEMEGTSLVATDLLVEDCGDPVSGGGAGIVAWNAPARLERVVVRDSRTAALLVIGELGAVIASDLLIVGTRSTDSGLFGYGVGVHQGATAELSSLRVVGAATFGVLVSDATASIDGLVVEAAGTANGGRYVAGVAAQGGAVVRLDRAEIVGTAGVGISALGADTSVVGQSVSVSGVAGLSCGSDCGLPAGIGVGAYESGSLDLGDFVLSGSDLCNVQVAGGQVDLRRGVVSDAPIGANVSTPGFDIERLTEEVRYHNNGVNLDSASLPVPMTGDTVEPQLPRNE